MLLVLLRHRVERVQDRLAPAVRGDLVFSGMLRGLNVMARRVAGVVQPGSLPFYIAVIILVVVGAPNILLISSGGWFGWPELAEVAAQPYLALALVVAGVGAAVVRRRFAAVLLLGAVGFTMALIFAVQGAADLALTQFAVESLSVVVFMLVIRHLPREFRPRRFRGPTVLRVAIASMVAGGVFSLAMMTNGGTEERAVSEEVIASAEPDGGGKNVVNVVLVDVRGLDTLGEITVLTAAAVGVVALARVGRRPSAEPSMDPERQA